MTFQSPLQDPATWSMTHEGRTLPAGSRYAGRVVWGVRATRPFGAPVAAPEGAVVRVLYDGPAAAVVELDLAPFVNRNVARRLPMGLPTFVVGLPVSADSLAALHGTFVAAGTLITNATEAWVACVGQDGAAVDAVAWSSSITAALAATGGASDQWEAFHTAVNGALGRPVLMLDHRSQPRRTGHFRITVSAASHDVNLEPADNGDLNAAVARARAAGMVSIPSVFAGGATTAAVADVTPGLPEPASTRWVRWEDGVRSQDTATITPAARHLAALDLHAWLAPQRAILPSGSPFGPTLERFRIGNKIVPFVDGEAFFTELVDQMRVVRDMGGGLHLAGWDLHHDFELRKRRAGETTDVTFEQLVQDLAGQGRQTRILVVQFYQGVGESGLPAVALTITALLFQIVLALGANGVRAVETNLGGGIFGFVALMGATAFAMYVQAEDGRPLEPSKQAVEALHPLPNTEAFFDPYPAETSDNPLASGIASVLGPINRFGVYHQKLIVMSRDDRLVAYAGGVDINPNRVDSPDHAAPDPFHDVHVRVEGPAAIDLARTFDQRWRHSQPGVAPAFTVPASQPAAGTDIVQIARTYFRSSSVTRALPFAPNGDFTISDTMLRAIRAAREYIYIEDQYLTPPDDYTAALVGVISARQVERVIIAVPTITDQPFGDLRRRAFVEALRTADTTGEIVRVGSLLPRPHAPEFERLAAGGKCYLHEPIGVGTGMATESVLLAPEAQVPDPPFWLSIDGELMLAVTPPSPPFSAPAGTTRVHVLRRAPSAVTRQSVLHEAGAPATVLDLTGIYVHSKMMLVDDVFIGVGSANLNRRGLSHDGELFVFSVPEELRHNRANPAAVLRRTLWAEHLGLRPAMADALLADPIASSRLFDRPWLGGGNRFVPIDFMPIEPVFNLAPGDSLLMFLLKGLITGVTLVDHAAVYDTAADPTTPTT